MSEAVLICLIGAGSAILSGVALKVLEHFLGSKKRKLDELTLIRNELRSDLTASRKETKDLRDELDRVESDLDTSRAMYWQLYADFERYKVAHPDPPVPP